jgi:adenine-specific DNA-methyltransferase
MGGTSEEHRAADTPELRKDRGAFFTPPEMAQFLIEWAIRSKNDRVLEPSCGEAAFLQPAARRLRQLGARGSDQLHGVELHQASAREAKRLAGAAGLAVDVRVGDFFDFQPEHEFDAVVGNPPYIRYQQFSGELRAKALRAALAQGVRLNQLASSWAAFLVHAARFLKPDGRLALVLPAELLAVNYAAPVRRFLLQRFRHVRLVMFEELVFPGVLEEVVLLMAEGSGSAECFEVYQARDISELTRLKKKGWSGFRPQDEGKWTGALVSPDALDEYQKAVGSDDFCPMLDWGETYLGAVTGNNRYFSLSASQVKELCLPDQDLLRISPPGSRHLRGMKFTDAAWRQAAAAGSSCYLFSPDHGRLSASAARYIKQGERDGVQHAYKCRVRDPWWQVPVVKVPDLLMTYMDQHRPRIVSNEAKAYHLNSLYGIALRDGVRKLGRDLLPIATLNSVTLLGAEMVGRSYGGGMLKLEPKEADKMPVPSPAQLERHARELRSLRPHLSRALRAGELDEAARQVDAVLLSQMSQAQIDALRAARSLLHSRRASRGRGIRG